MSLHRDLALDLAELHPDEAAAVLESLDAADAAGFLAGLPAERAAKVLQRTTAHPAAATLAQLDTARATDVTAQLPVEVAVGYLRRLASEVREPILDGMEPNRSRALRSLLRFQEGTAGALMDPEVLAVPEDLSVRDAVERVKKSQGHARYNLYVVDRDDRLVGVLNLRELLLGRPRQPLAAIMSRDVIRLRADADWREVVEHPGWREVHSLPVVDEGEVYLGAVRYRTLRSLEDKRRAPAIEQSVTAQALGDLFAAAMSGVIEALAVGTPADRRQRRSERGDE